MMLRPSGAHCGLRMMVKVPLNVLLTGWLTYLTTSTVLPLSSEATNSVWSCRMPPL